MAVRLHFAEDLLDLSVFRDQERAALHPHVRAAVHAFFDPGAVSFGDFVIDVGEQRKRQLEFVFELGQRSGLVGRYAENLRAGGGELFGALTEPLRFLVSSRCVGLGEEIEDDAFALERGEVEGLTLVVLCVDGGSRVAFVEGFGHGFIVAAPAPKIVD